MIEDTTVRYFDKNMTGAPAASGSAGAAINIIDTCRAGFNSTTVSSLVVSDNVATITVPTGHGITNYCTGVGAVAEISGVTTPAVLNGEWRVHYISATQLWFYTEGVSDQTATGTISIKRAPLKLSKTFSGTNLAAYQFLSNVNSTTGYLYIDDTTGYLKNRVIEGMTDISTWTNASPETATIKGNYFWYIIADDLSIHFSINTGQTGFVFGDLIPFMTTDRYHCFTTGTSQYCYETSPPYVMRSINQTGTYMSIYHKTFIPGSVSTPNYEGNYYFSPVIAVQNSNPACFRGIFPGVLTHHHTGIAHGTTLNIVGESHIYMACEGYYMFYAYDMTGPWR